MLYCKLLFGKIGEWLMEFVVCWIFVMIGIGIVLWWLCGVVCVGCVLWFDLLLCGWLLWKSFYVMVGIWFVVGMVVFILIGLLWLGLWGKNFKVFVVIVNFGVLEGVWGGVLVCLMCFGVVVMVG